AGIRRIQGEIAIDNAVSRKVFRRDGFREAALLCDFVRQIEPREAGTLQPAALVSSAPPFDPSSLAGQLRALGWEDAPGTDAGRLTSLPGRADWWRGAAGRLVQMPYVLLDGLPATGAFRVLLVIPGASNPHRTRMGRVSARLRMR